MSANNILSFRALQWAVNAVSPGASVLSVERLKGGISSPVHGICLSVNGDERSVVLRQFDNVEWLQEQPDLALREAVSLRRAARVVGVQTPRLIAFDENGSQCGAPAVLMSRLDGKVVLEPEDVSHWLTGMAQALVHIHEVEPADFPWVFTPYRGASSLDTSKWSRFPDKWRKAAEIVKGTRPSFKERFIHRDYHPANILWSGEAVSGVVDWVNGCIGPAGIDVGHCRTNLSVLHGVDAADKFLQAYIRLAGDSFIYDPYWDLVTLIDFADDSPEIYGGWTALGMNKITMDLMIERLDRYLLSLLERVSGI